MDHLGEQEEPGIHLHAGGATESVCRLERSRLTSARSALIQLVTLTRNNVVDRRSGEHT